MPTKYYILSIRIIVCYVVFSYKHAVAFYTHPVIFNWYFLIEHTENTYGISAIWSTCSWDSVYHYLITYCLPVIQHHSPTLYAQYLQFLFLEINYSGIILYALRFLLFQKLCQHILCIPKYWTMDITKQWGHKGNWNYKLPEDKYWIKQ